MSNRHIKDDSDMTILSSIFNERKFPYARLYTSRGCPFDCSFCQVGSISGRKFRFQSIEKVISEMKILKNRYLKN